jgi:hypothetical protein
MGLTVDEILATAQKDASVKMTIVSNEEDGIASYASGLLTYTPSTGGVVLGGPKLQPATLAGTMKYLFSDRQFPIDPKPSAGSFGSVAPRQQQFDGKAPEPLAVSMTLTSTPTVPVKLSFFGGTATVSMERRGKLLVGVGPSLGQSQGGVYVISFNALHQPQSPPK